MDENYRHKIKEISKVFITDKNKVWIETLSQEDVFKFRRLLKKERDSLPPKYRRYYLLEDNKLKELMYTMILYLPMLTDLHEQARHYLRFQALQKPTLHKCKDCRWFYQAPLIDDNVEITEKKSCQELGALGTDLACEGYIDI